MKFHKTLALPTFLTTVAFVYSYTRDAQDGAVGWGLLLAGTLIAALGFFGGTYVVAKVSAKNDHT